MSEHDSNRPSSQVAIESGREVAEEAPSSGAVLLEDDLERVAAAGSNGIRFGQEGN
jgi:hypothetical protein